MSSSVIETRFGEIEVSDGEDGVTLTADFEAKAFVIGDGRRSVKFFAGRLPMLYDEVTQNGHTFEVQGTRITETGKLQVENEQGVWEDYQ